MPDWLDSPGAIAASLGSGNDNFSPTELSLLDTSALLSVPTSTPSPPMDDILSGIASGAAIGAAPAATSSIFSSTGGSSLLGGLLGTLGTDALNLGSALFINPLVAQKQLQTQAQANLVSQQNAAALAGINTQSLTTLIFWGAIAFALVSLVKKA